MDELQFRIRGLTRRQGRRLRRLTSPSTLNTGFWPWLFLVALAAAAYGSGPTLPIEPNISGLWVGDNGAVVRLSQDGQNIRSILVQPSELGVELGFSVGDLYLTGTLDGRLLRGDISIHFPLSAKSTCGDQWATVSDIELTLSEDNNTLRGRWKREKVNANCEFVSETWVPIQYERPQ